MPRSKSAALKKKKQHTTTATTQGMEMHREDCKPCQWPGYKRLAQLEGFRLLCLLPEMSRGDPGFPNLFSLKCPK